MDVEHKRRGRPPLKPEDPTMRRPFESALSPTAASLHRTRRSLSRGPSGLGRHSTYQRGYQPSPPGPSFDPNSRPSLPRGLSFQSMYAPPSISPSPTTATGTIISPGRSYSTGPMPLPGQPPSPYQSTTPSEPALRSMAPYPGAYSYPPPQGQMGPPSQLLYSTPIFPRPVRSPRQSDALASFQGPSGLQLPPIRPAPPGGPVDPAIAQRQRQHGQQQQQQQQQQPPQQPQQSQQSQQSQQPQQQPQQQARENQGSGNDGSREPEPKRPKMDIQGILGP